MGNEVAKANPFGEGQVATLDRKAMAEKAAASAQTSPRGGAPGDADYMNFSGKRGMYTIGQEKRRVDIDELWVLNIASLEDGWICWKGGKPVSTRMWNIFTGAPVPRPSDDEQGPFDPNKGEGWHQAKGWVAKSLDNDQQGYFKNNSVSGVAEMADMIEEVAKRLGVGQPCWPVFSYDMEEFEAQGYKNFKPKFTLYGWLDDEAIQELGADADADIDELIAKSGVNAMIDKPKETKATKKEEPAEEPETSEEPARSGRRRRRSA